MLAVITLRLGLGASVWRACLFGCKLCTGWGLIHQQILRTDKTLEKLGKCLLYTQLLGTLLSVCLALFTSNNVPTLVLYFVNNSSSRNVCFEIKQSFIP